jgi:hexosaminidase
MWEGFSKGTDIPKDIWILNWESSYFRPDLMLQDGYTVINAGWDPLYVVDHYPWIQYTYHTMEHLYTFDRFTFGHVADGYPASNGITVPTSSDVPGAEMCWWEGKGYNGVPFLRNRIPPFSARIWNPEEERCFESFKARVESTEPLLERLLFPVTIMADGLLNQYWKQARQFTDTIEVSMSSQRQGTIRYTLDGKEPNVTSTPYTRPIDLTATTTVKAALFQGKEQLGFVTRIGYQKVTQIDNITRDKKVTTDATLFIEHPPSLVVDGVIEKDTYWTAYRSPKWIRIDLGGPVSLNSVTVYSRWGGGYYEQYTVDVSLDGENWNLVADYSQNTTPATASGYNHSFPATMVRYIRLNTLGNSWFPSGHFPRIVEIHAGEAE